MSCNYRCVYVCAHVWSKAEYVVKIHTINPARTAETLKYLQLGGGGCWQQLLLRWQRLWLQLVQVRTPVSVRSTATPPTGPTTTVGISPIWGNNQSSFKLSPLIVWKWSNHRMWVSRVKPTISQKVLFACRCLTSPNTSSMGFISGEQGSRNLAKLQHSE